MSYPQDPYTGAKNPYSDPQNQYGSTEYRGPEIFRPLSAWAYVGYSLLFAIPIVGLICVIVFACSNTNINRRNYARSLLIGLVIGIVLALILSAITGINLASLYNQTYNRYGSYYY